LLCCQITLSFANVTSFSESTNYRRQFYKIGWQKKSFSPFTGCNVLGESALSFCYRNLSAWRENHTDQPSMSFHYATAGRAFLGCNTPILLSFCFLICANAKSLRRATLPEALFISVFPYFSRSRTLEKPDIY